jgi:hypothetical protein
MYSYNLPKNQFPSGFNNKISIIDVKDGNHGIANGHGRFVNVGDKGTGDALNGGDITVYPGGKGTVFAKSTGTAKGGVLHAKENGSIAVNMPGSHLELSEQATVKFPEHSAPTTIKTTSSAKLTVPEGVMVDAGSGTDIVAEPGSLIYARAGSKVFVMPGFPGPTIIAEPNADIDGAHEEARLYNIPSSLPEAEIDNAMSLVRDKQTEKAGYLLISCAKNLSLEKEIANEDIKRFLLVLPGQHKHIRAGQIACVQQGGKFTAHTGSTVYYEKGAEKNTSGFFAKPNLIELSGVAISKAMKQIGEGDDEGAQDTLTGIQKIAEAFTHFDLKENIKGRVPTYATARTSSALPVTADPSSMVIAEPGSQVNAKENSIVYAQDDSTVTAHSNAIIFYEPNATIISSVGSKFKRYQVPANSELKGREDALETAMAMIREGNIPGAEKVLITFAQDNTKANIQKNNKNAITLDMASEDL